MDTRANRHPEVSSGPRFAESRKAIGGAVGFNPALSSEVVDWQHVGLFAWHGQCGEAQFEPFEEPVIVYHVGGAHSVAVRTRGRSTDQTHPGTITIIPPATRVGWVIRGEVCSRTLHLNSRFFDDPANDERLLERELRFCCGVRDPLLAAAFETLEDEIRAPSQFGSLYADSVANTLALHLKRTRFAKARTTSPRAGLSGTALRRSLELLEASIAGGISLQALANEARLSRTYFAQAFRNETGLAPHRYLTRLRLERARELLASGTESIAEIAFQCGFSSQAHLSTTFRNAYGVSPRRYRLDH